MGKPIQTPLGYLCDQVNEMYPEGNLQLIQAAKLINLVDEDRQRVAEATTPPSQPPEIVRVMRVYVFEGERKRVEEQLAHSLGEGTRYVSGRPGDGLKGNGIKIHVATIGAIPQILPLNAGYPGWAGKGYSADLSDLPIAEPLGAHMVYVCRPEWAGHIQAEYDRAVACGATAMVIPCAADGTASNLYSIDQFRKQWAHSLKLKDLPESAAPPPTTAPPAEIPPPPPPPEDEPGEGMPL